MDRISWDEYGLVLASAVSTRATCPRRQVGAVIMDNYLHTIVATGYNGAPSDDEHCTEVGCLMVDGHCKRTIHAEENAIIQFLEKCFHSTPNPSTVTLYCTLQPCDNCMELIKAVGIERIIWNEDYE